MEMASKFDHIPVFIDLFVNLKLFDDPFSGFTVIRHSQIVCSSLIVEINFVLWMALR